MVQLFYYETRGKCIRKIFTHEGSPTKIVLYPYEGENLDLSRCTEVHTDSIVRDRAYFLAKYCQTDGLLPGWTGWNQVLHKDSHPINNVGYLPIIDSSPTDKATVQTILGKNLEIAHALNLQSIVLVMNQAIYAKAQEIQWQGPLVFRDRIIIRLGEFHTAMAFLGAVGKRFQDSGLSGWAQSALTSHWLLKTYWWSRSRVKIVEVVGSIKMELKGKIKDCGHGNIVITGKYKEKPHKDFRLCLTSNISNTDFDLGYCVTGTVERGDKDRDRHNEKGGMDLTHFAMIKRRGY